MPKYLSLNQIKSLFPVLPASAPEQEEVIEETISAQGATTTGNNVENPAHTQALNDAAK